MTIDTELLLKIYARSKEYATAKFGHEPSQIGISEDGLIKVIYEYYSFGNWETETEYISAENLTEDLEIVAKERAERLEAEKKKREAAERENQRKRDEIERDNRRMQYLKLKKGFDNK